MNRFRPNELWDSDITQPRTRECWLYCCAVLEGFSRRIVGWSIDSRTDSTLVVNALDMATRHRRPTAGGIVHADQGAQFTSWVSAKRSALPGLCRLSARLVTDWITPLLRAVQSYFPLECRCDMSSLLGGIETLAPAAIVVI
jgi:transposase InsO family protein